MQPICFFFFFKMRRNPADGARRDGMVATQHQRDPPFLNCFLDRCAQVLARVRDFLNILRALFADGHLFRLLYGDIANVFHLKAKVLDARLQPGYA